MKILFLLKEEPDATIRAIMEEIRRNHDLHLLNLRDVREYDQLVQQIVACDRVICW